jgi:hypothetical protein
MKTSDAIRHWFIGVALIWFAPPLVLVVASSLADFFLAPEVVQPLSAFAQDFSFFWGAAIGSTFIRALFLTAIWLLFHATAVRWRSRIGWTSDTLMDV